MKRIIDGKRYDSTKAELVACRTNNLPCTDFNYFHETLYRTEKGAWFLCAEGGAATQYASRPRPGERSGGEALIPMTPDDVRQYAEAHDMPGVIEVYFPETIEEA